MIIVHEDQVYESQEHELFSSFQPIETVKQEPSIKWKKSPISMDMWEDIKNICAFTNKEHNSECLIRLYYSPEKDMWAPGFFKQKMSFMTVKDEFDIEEKERQAPSIEGFVEAGSVHHHCGSGAFQSKTDEDDEQNSNGLHITIGKMNDKKYELHSRFSQEGTFLSPNMLSFFEQPDWLSQVPEEWRWRFSYTVVKDLLQKPGDPDKARKDWIENIIPKATTITRSSPYNKHSVPAGQQTFYNGGHSGYGYSSYYKDDDFGILDNEPLPGVSIENSIDDEITDVMDMFEEIVNDVVYDTANMTELPPANDWEDLKKAFLTVINCSKDSAEKCEAMPYLSELHECLRSTVSEKRAKNKKMKKDLTLTNFGSWLKVLNDIDFERLVTDAFADFEADLKESGIDNTVPLLPVV